MPQVGERVPDRRSSPWRASNSGRELKARARSDAENEPLQFLLLRSMKKKTRESMPSVRLFSLCPSPPFSLYLFYDFLFHQTKLTTGRRSPKEARHEQQGNDAAAEAPRQSRRHRLPPPQTSSSSDFPRAGKEKSCCPSPSKSGASSFPQEPARSRAGARASSDPRIPPREAEEERRRGRGSFCNWVQSINRPAPSKKNRRPRLEK